MKKKIWKKTEMGNVILRGKGFYISYNPFVSMLPFGWGGDENEETALVKDDIFYILNGDFRKEYEKLIDKGFNACKKFYDGKKEKYDSSWSTENW